VSYRPKCYFGDWSLACQLIVREKVDRDGHDQ